VQRHLPIYFKAYPGSVSDVSTLKNLLAEVRELGVEECLLIMDRGFYSLGNVEDMDFIVPLPFGKGLAKDLISESNRLLDDSDKGHLFNKELYSVHRRRWRCPGTASMPS
jgi:transposase